MNAGEEGRQRVAQRSPAVPLDGFPTHRLTAGTACFRAHRRDLGPWWFASDGGGRFDLPAPRGTCYLADDPLVALRERLGPVLGEAGALPVSLLEATLVSRLPAPGARLADLRSRGAADFGVTRELEVMVPYDVPQRWAAAFDVAGLEGVRYGPRLTPGDATSYAVFGPAGTADGPTDPDAVVGAEVPGAPRGLTRPRRDELTVVRPPRTRGRPAAPPTA